MTWRYSSIWNFFKWRNIHKWSHLWLSPASLVIIHQSRRRLWLCDNHPLWILTSVNFLLHTVRRFCHQRHRYCACPDDYPKLKASTGSRVTHCVRKPLGDPSEQITPQELSQVSLGVHAEAVVVINTCLCSGYGLWGSSTHGRLGGGIWTIAGEIRTNED